MKRLLYIAHRVPYPPDKGERVRAFNEIKALSGHFRITLAALAHGKTDPQAADALAQWCEKVIVAPAGGKLGLIRGALCLLAGGSVTEGYFRSRRLRTLIAAEAAREPFDLVMAYSSSILPYALAAPAGARVIDPVDVDSAKWAGYADKAAWPTSRLYRREAAGVRALEGLDVEIGRDVLQADTPAQWQSAIRDTVADEPLRTRLGRVARARIEAGYTWAGRMAPLVPLCLRQANTQAAADGPARPVGLATAKEGISR